MKRRSVIDTQANRHALNVMCISFTTNSAKSKLFVNLSNYDFHVVKNCIPDQIKKSVRPYSYVGVK